MLVRIQPPAPLRNRLSTRMLPLSGSDGGIESTFRNHLSTTNKGQTMSKNVGFHTDERGFKRLKPIQTDYGEVLSVHESSSALEPKVWLSVNFEDSFSGQETHSNAMIHLDFEDIEQLIAQLKWIKKNHYNL